MAIRHEWLVTNGLGGYACGTVAGAHTRRYHGLLMAALSPPVGRTLLVAKVDATAHYRGISYPLFANEFAGGTIDPHGYTHLESFAVENGIPTWRFALGDALLEQRVYMAPGANTTYLRFELLRATGLVQLDLTPLVTYRDYHSQGRGSRPFHAASGDGGCLIEAFDGARPYRLSLSQGRYTPRGEWYWNFLHREESARGLDDLEDLWVPGLFNAGLAVAEPLYFTASAEPGAPAAGLEVIQSLVKHSQKLQGAVPETAPAWIRALGIASAQFIVQRGNTTAGDALAGNLSIIAGYPWFADWGRDTMIALPGLATAMKRFDVAANILRNFAGFVDRGMLPNRFPDHGETLEYNTADAVLWMFQALDDYLMATQDPALQAELFPVLAGVIHAHVEGTRFGIGVDPADGLLHVGEAGLQLTWMDAKHGDTVFTPRMGKPVEINALWLNALDMMTRLAARLGNDGEKRFCEDLLQRAGRGFMRFWNDGRRCLYDVIDVAGGTAHDESIRPNQIFAVALPYCVLSQECMRAVVDICGQTLLTSHGLRSLSPDDDAYIGRYRGDPWARDSAYHQGTVWAWLLGPFVRAHYRVYGDAALAQSFLAPLAQHVDAACQGTISEIFEGDAPHAARGCFAQAWSVGEILRSWLFLERLNGRQ